MSGPWEKYQSSNEATAAPQGPWTRYKSGGDIQSVRPAVRTMDNQLVVGSKGDTHNDIINDNGLPATSIDRRMFVDGSGKPVSRTQLANAGVAGVPGSVPGAHASELSKAQESSPKSFLDELTSAMGRVYQPPAPVPPATPPSETWSALNKPVLPSIKSLEVKPNDSPYVAAGKEALSLAYSVPQFFTSPAGMATSVIGALPKAAASVAAKGFGLGMLYSLGKQIKEDYKDWDRMTPAQKTAAVVDMAGTGLFARALTGRLTPETPSSLPVLGEEATHVPGSRLAMRPGSPAPSEIQGAPWAEPLPETPKTVPFRGLLTKPLPEPTVFDQSILDRAGFPNSIEHLKRIFPKLQMSPDQWEQLFQEARVNARRKAGEPSQPQPKETYAVPERSPTPVHVDVPPPDSGGLEPRKIVGDRKKGIQDKEQGTAVPQAQQLPKAQAQALTPEEQAIEQARLDTELGQEDPIEPPKGDRMVTVERPDGTTYQAAFGDKYYDHPKRGKVASIAKLVNGKWSHGMLAPGEKIVEENKPPTPSTPEVSQSPVPAEAVLKGGVATTPAPPITPSTTKPAETQAAKSPIETLNTSSQVKITAPKGATMVRVTDANGKTAVQDIKSIQGQNVFQGAGIKKIEAGTIGKDKKFTPVKGEVTVEPKMIGMGGALEGEVESGAGSDIFGISQKAREEMAKAGVSGLSPTGEGISAPDSIQRGRDLISKGADPERVVSDFQKSNALSADGMAIVRARGEQLRQAARSIEEKFGTQSPEYATAWQSLSSWLDHIKPMQTEWHKIGEAQQGATDVDTGTFTGLQEAYRQSTGKDFTPKQAAGAKKVSADVQDKTGQEGKALATLYGTLSKETGLDPVKKPPMTPEQAKSSLNEIQRIFSGHDASKPFTMEQVKALWQYAKSAYIDNGETDFPQLLTNLAVDTGLPRSEVARALAQPKAVKMVTDELYRKMSNRRRAVDQAKNWLQNQRYPGWLRFIRAIPRVFFVNKIFGHGTVGMITHAGLNMFSPTAWRTYWPNFFKQFAYVFNKGYHQRAMNDLLHDPNFVLARRAGLANDPFKYTDDYQSATMKTFMGKLGGLVGNRGFDALKTFRQARFNQEWNRLPESLKTKDMAKLIADGINHATGIVKSRLPEASNWTFFAPKLELSRWAWLIGDTAKSAKIFKEWRNSTPEERAFAIADLKQKAYIAGTYFGLLALNQGLLSAMGSKQKVNWTNPRRGDFLAFKVGDSNLGIVSPLLGMVRLFANLYHDSMGERTPLQKLTPRGQQIAQDIGSYLRGKLSPFASTVYDVASQSDFQGRPLPWSKDKPPAYLRRRGLGTYTYKEWAETQFTPIPVEEAVKEVWAAQGMSEPQMNVYLRAITTALVAGGTGARLSPDYYLQQQQKPTNSGKVYIDLSPLNRP